MLLVNRGFKHKSGKCKGYMLAWFILQSMIPNSIRSCNKLQLESLLQGVIINAKKYSANPLEIEVNLNPEPGWVKGQEHRKWGRPLSLDKIIRPHYPAASTPRATPPEISHATYDESKKAIHTRFIWTVEKVRARQYPEAASILWISTSTHRFENKKKKLRGFGWSLSIATVPRGSAQYEIEAIKGGCL